MVSLKHNLARFFFNRFKKYEAQLHELNYLFWESTLKCNLNCIHCGSDCSQNASTPDMPASDFIKVLENIKKELNPTNLLIAITGGEPLLRNDLEETGIQIKKLGFNWGIVTNGYAYTQARQAKLVEAGLSTITLSIDGLETNHNWLRNSNSSFSKAFNALKIIQSEKFLYFDIVTCVNQRNILDLPEMLALFIKEEVKIWRMFTITPIGRASSNNELHLTPTQFTYLMNFIKENRLIGKIDIKFSCEGYVGDYENLVRDGFFFCRAGINIASVLIDGSISACPNINHSFIQGNIYKHSFVDIWQNNFEEMRNRKWTKTGKCSHCLQYKHCQGNGLHYWTAERNNVMQCHFQMLNQCN